jgi:hypothetical protein
MRRIMIVVSTVIVCPGLLGAADPPAAGRADEPWQSVTLLRDGGLTVRLKCRREASLADTEWLALEFENAGPAPVHIRNLNYRLERVGFNARTGQRLHSGGLASGSDVALFPEVYRARPAVERVVAPGQTMRSAQQPSDYSAALLGLPPRDGLRVDVTAHVSVTFADRRTVETPAVGVPFTFLWGYPDDAGFRAMRERLKKLLATPEQSVYQVYIVQALLKVPEVSAAVTKDELLAALACRERVPWARRYIAGSLAQRFPQDAAARDYYRRRLRARDGAVVFEVAAPGLWHPEFVGPLVELFEADRTFSSALTVLHEHRGDWRADPKVTGSLAAAVRRHHPILARPLAGLQPQDLQEWSAAAHELGMTSDGSVVAQLRPALDDRRSWEVISATVRPGTRQRVCDAALEAILTALDDSRRTAFASAPEAFPPLGGDNDKAFAARDRLIADLKKRLAAMDGEKKPGP